MKVAIASDIHGSYPATVAFFYAAERLGAEKYILLGDLYYHGIRNPLPEGYAPLKVAEYLNERADKLLVVKGNCDSDVDMTVSNFDFASSLLLDLNGKIVYCTHGDKYDKDHLPKGAYDLFLYGHFHTGLIEKAGGVIVANPGSLSLPKGGTERSFLLLDDGKLTLHSLQGDVLAESEI
ncbi:MAG: phosphodiesterase [Clostridia bacterium]|nr:phosphodiesterase [Clostridia bacterium]